MWLRKLFSKVRYRALQRTVTTLPARHQPYRSILAEILTELNPAYFKHYRASAGLTINVPTLYPNIEIYTRRLRDTCGLVRRERPVPNDWLPTEMQTINLDRFLISIDGYYLDLETAIADFRKVALQLCTLMEESDHESYGLPEHNLRVLTKLFVNLRELALQLINVSLTKS